MSWFSNARKKKSGTDDGISEHLQQKNNLPLGGKVVAVTSLMSSSVGTCPENHVNIVELCHEAGAETTTYVDETVFCVIASSSAVAGETQAVCKGWRMGIPVVKYWWLSKCIEEGKILPFGKAQALPPEPVKKKAKKAVERKAKPSASMDVNSTKRRKKLPLAGKVVAVSTLIESSVEESCPENYKNVIQLCHDAGAETTGQVHKRVYCVVATSSAVAGQTQRVRKGWKLGIPVVKTEWLRKCIEAGKEADFGDCLVPPPEQAQKKSESSETNEKAATVVQANNNEESLAKEGWSEQVDLGCCCVCHENAEGVTDCKWCVSCSANLAAKQAAK